jgi:hypothetical protein
MEHALNAGDTVHITLAHMRDIGRAKLGQYADHGAGEVLNLVGQSHVNVRFAHGTRTLHAANVQRFGGTL